MVEAGPGRVLVTGAGGFVGTRCVDALLRQGVAVTAAVRRPGAFTRAVRVWSVGDVGPETRWVDALAECDAVVHLAARVHVMRESADRYDDVYRRVNVDGTVNLARQAAEAGVSRVVFVSTIKVHGEETLPGRPFTEQDPIVPRDAYARSKAEAEVALRSLAAATGMSTVIIRPPVVYGPGVQANFLTLTRWVVRGVPLPLGAVRDNRRTMLAVDNLVDLIGVCLRHPRAANQVFLAGDAEALSTADLIRRCGAALGAPVRLLPVPVPVLRAAAGLSGCGDLMQRLLGSLEVSIAKAREVLTWTPPVSVDEGLRRMACAQVGVVVSKSIDGQASA